MRKAIVLFYLVVLGFSYWQVLWFFGVPAVGGLVLTPSAHPYIPPLSLIIVRPSNVCDGFSVYYQNAQLFGINIKIPVVHYFAGNYEFYNYKARLGETPLETIKNYFEALIWPSWAVVNTKKQCVAQVIAVVPAPLVLFSFVALTIPIYYGIRRVW